MTNLILAGSGGCMRELVWQIAEQNKVSSLWNIAGYVDCNEPENGSGITVGESIIPYLGNDDYLMSKKEPVNVVICVGAPHLRRKLAQKYRSNPAIRFPSLVLGDVKVCGDVHMGTGCIVSMDARISTNVILGDFVFMNTGSMVCHDGILGDFVTLSPDVKLAGAVKVGSGSDIGMGTKVIQGICIGENVVAGAGSVIVRDIPAGSKVAGVPAGDIAVKAGSDSLR